METDLQRRGQPSQNRVGASKSVRVSGRSCTWTGFEGWVGAGWDEADAGQRAPLAEQTASYWVSVSKVEKLFFLLAGGRMRVPWRTHSPPHQLGTWKETSHPWCSVLIRPLLCLGGALC